MFTDHKNTALVAAFVICKGSFAKAGAELTDDVQDALASFGYSFEGYTDKGAPSVKKGSADINLSSFVPALWGECRGNAELRSRVYGVHITSTDGRRLAVGPMIDRKVTGNGPAFIPASAD